MSRHQATTSLQKAIVRQADHNAHRNLKKLSSFTSTFHMSWLSVAATSISPQ